MDSMLPIIRQMHEAPDDRARALVLLTVSDRVLVQYRHVFEDACRRSRFDLGLSFIDVRRAAFHAVRGPDGLHKNALFEEAREAFSHFAHASRDASQPAAAVHPAGRDNGPGALSGASGDRNTGEAGKADGPSEPMRGPVRREAEGDSGRTPR